MAIHGHVEESVIDYEEMKLVYADIGRLRRLVNPGG